MPPSSTAAPSDRPEIGTGFARRAYRWRWPLAFLLGALIALAFANGVGRVSGFSADVAALADTSNGSGAVKPLFFDPSMDIWFGDEDAAVETYYQIERTFVAEDYVMVTFQVEDDPLGVFRRDSLAAIARLTEQFLTIPGVRHVQSLTYNPWIRWGAIDGGDEGLIISDLVEGDPRALSDDQIVERMVATLGAERVAQRLGAERVREVIGADADFSEFIGEPLLLGTILDEGGTTTAIQIQVLRPRMDAETLGERFEDDGTARVAANLSSIEQQRAAVRGIEHFLRLEAGLALRTPEALELEARLAALPGGEDKTARLFEFGDPNRNFYRDEDGSLVRKFFEYDVEGAGYVDRSDPSNVVEAPEGFQPEPLSEFRFHLGGVPLFERNFEQVGIADGKFVPLMFLVIILVLFAVFRRVSGVVVPLTVVFGSIMAMVGVAFTRGDLLNNLTMMSPNMLTAVGIADAIHLVAAYVILRSQYDDRAELITEVIRRNALPVFLTSLTTAVGFYSLTISKLVPVQMLGTMAAMGTFFAWALSMTFIPALLSLVPHTHRTGAVKPSLTERFFSRARSERLVDLILRFRRGILAGTALLVAIGIVGVLRVEVDSDFRGMFPDDNATMSDFQWIEDRMGGVGDMEIVFRGLEDASGEEPTRADEARLAELTLRELGSQREPDEFEALDEEESAELAALRQRLEDWNAKRIGVLPDFLASLEAFELRLREEMADPDSRLAVVTDLVSPLDTLRKIGQVQNENRAAYYRVPREDDVPEALRDPRLDYDEWTEEWSYTPGQEGVTLVAQYYLQYESGARPGESLRTRLSADGTQFRVQGRILQDSSVTHLKAFQRIEEIAREEFPELAANLRAPADDAGEAHSDFTISGKTLLFARTSDLFARGFVQSMAIAIAAITLLIGVIFRSVLFAAVSLIPNLLPIMLPLSVFGLLGVPLDGPAILVSSVALGVCVDDTIHFLTKFGRARHAGKDPRESLIAVMMEAGAAMTVTTVVLIIGFSTLLLSDFSPNFQMGALASLMIGLAWVADFVVTSAVLAGPSAQPSRPSTHSEPARATVLSS